MLASQEFNRHQNGSVFQLAALAFYQLEFELGSRSTRPVGIEVGQDVSIPIAGSPIPFTKTRKIDIVLDQGNTKTEDSIWVEVKSYIGKNLNASLWTIAVANRRTSNHQEFSIDCFHLVNDESSRIRWWFQDFKVRNRARTVTAEGPDAKQMSNFNIDLHRVPRNAIASDFNAVSGKICNNQKARLFTGMNLVRDTVLTNISEFARTLVTAFLPTSSS